nr:hypothetical protein [Tanacetum cinerariifolium]
VVRLDKHVIEAKIITVEGVLHPVAPTTAEQKLARKNEPKAHGTLLMALPDKHQLKFNSKKCQDTDGSYREEVWREHRNQESSKDPLEATI